MEAFHDAFDVVAYGAAKRKANAYTDAEQALLQDFTTVAGSGAGSDTYALDLLSAKYKRFAITIADTDAKIVTLANVPTGRAEFEIEITTSAVGSVTWTLNSGSSLAWANVSAPTLASGKVYLIQFRTSDNGVTWDGYASWGV